MPVSLGQLLSSCLPYGLVLLRPVFFALYSGLDNFDMLRYTLSGQSGVLEHGCLRTRAAHDTGCWQAEFEVQVFLCSFQASLLIDACQTILINKLIVGEVSLEDRLGQD